MSAAYRTVAVPTVTIIDDTCQPGWIPRQPGCARQRHLLGWPARAGGDP